jgi:hypothetical protein
MVCDAKMKRPRRASAGSPLTQLLDRSRRTRNAGLPVFIPITKIITQRPLPGSRAINCVLSLFGCPTATLGAHQQPLATNKPTWEREPAMSGVVILGLVALSAWLAINIAIAVAVVVLGKR